MVELVAFYKSFMCTYGFYTESFENGKYLPSVVQHYCETCQQEHDFMHDINHIANGHSTASKLLEAWAVQNGHAFGIKIKDIE